MNDVTRWDTDSDVFESNEGWFVTHEDYTAMREKVWQEAIDAACHEFEHRKDWFNAICDDVQEGACDNVLEIIRKLPNPYKAQS